LVLGLFSCPGPLLAKEEIMSQTELAFAKKCVLATREWDTYQAILRKCLKPSKVEPGPKVSQKQ
jgi:hypothetical protein